LQIADDGGRRSVRLGPDLAAGEVPQAIVRRRRGKPQKAPATGRWSDAPWRRDSILQHSNWREGWEPTSSS